MVESGRGGERSDRPRGQREEPEMLPALPGPCSLSQSRRRTGRRPGRRRRRRRELLSPGAQALAASSASPSPERARLGGRGRRSVQGGGEGGAQAPAWGGGAGRMCTEFPRGLSELLQGFTVDLARHQTADPALLLALCLAGSLFSPLSLSASLYFFLISVCQRKK